jgi:cytochrome oxidase Cu insertion factor (SCO1/SenC/PrrC family)
MSWSTPIHNSVRRAGALTVLLVTVTVALAAFASSARGDGDPASDYLVSRQVFLTSQSNSESPEQRRLVSLVAAANRAGFPIRVAVVSTEYDLGSVTALWHKPALYARFLGLELGLNYRQHLLVVMPNGFGVNWPGHRASSAYRLLVGIRIASGPDSLAEAGQTAVRHLAAAAGVKLSPAADLTAAGKRPASRSSSPASFAIIGAAVAVLCGAILVLLGLRRRGRRTEPKVPKVARPPRDGPSGGRLESIPLRWAVSGSAALLILAVGIPIVLVSRRSPAAGEPAADVPAPPPFTWRAGQRPAPNFVLRDQQGRRVSMAGYRGRPVILTFVDPLCRNLCPLEAHLLNHVVEQMPASQRPAILAVSVDPPADARANLLTDERKWSLVPQWHWAVGPHAELAAVWKHYSIGVSVTTKRIARTTIRYIIHTEAAYVIDPTGHERALFLWPFYPQDVERTLRQLS